MLRQRDTRTVHDFNVAYFFIRKSSGSKTKLLPEIEEQFRDLHRDFLESSVSGRNQRIRCVDSFQIQSSLDPVKLEPNVREDLNQQGTEGQVLFVLKGVEAMTCEIQNWITFCGNFPHLRVWLVIAQHDLSKYLRGRPEEIWTPPCAAFPNRRRAIWRLEDVLTAWVGSDSTDVKENHILKLWKTGDRIEKAPYFRKSFGGSHGEI